MNQNIKMAVITFFAGFKIWFKFVQAYESSKIIFFCMLNKHGHFLRSLFIISLLNNSNETTTMSTHYTGDRGVDLRCVESGSVSSNNGRQCACRQLLCS